MGILVPEAILPMGITLSNVYMSFSGETVYVNPRLPGNVYRINTSYRIYLDPSKEKGTNISIPMTVTVNDIGRDTIFGILYTELKTIYPGSEDVLDIISQ